MADEPDQLITRILQQIQADVSDVKAGIAKLDRRVDHIERDVRELRTTFMYVAGAATVAEQRAREVDGRVDDLNEKMKALEAALAEKH